MEDAITKYMLKFYPMIFSHYPRFTEFVLGVMEGWYCPLKLGHPPYQTDVGQGQRLFLASHNSCIQREPKPMSYVGRFAVQLSGAFTHW